jgi:DNA repair exonuclease SbcCD ATPase subunit
MLEYGRRILEVGIVNGAGDDRKRGFFSRLSDALLVDVDKYVRDLKAGLVTGASGRPSSRLSLDSAKLQEELRDEIEREGEGLKKFLDLVASFTDIIPEEGKRYHAAMKALSHAADLTSQHVVEAANRQIAALKKQRDGFARSVADRRTELKALSRKSQDIKSQIANLQNRIRRMEEEERELMESVAAGERELESAEDAFANIVENLEYEIADTRKKVMAYLLNEVPEAEDTAIPEIPVGSEQAVPSIRGAEEPDRGDVTIKLTPPETQESGPGSDAKQKSCPVCNNRMEWYGVKKMWKCFVCAHEEAG